MPSTRTYALITNYTKRNQALIYDLMKQVSGSIRKGEVLEASNPELKAQLEATDGTPVTAGGVAEFFFMPSMNDVRADLEIVDMVFINIGVDKAKAESKRDEIIAYLDTLDPALMEGGPSYIPLGAVVGDQETAMQLMAVGQVLGLWQVMTPMALGITDQALELAGSGLLMITGYKKNT